MRKEIQGAAISDIRKAFENTYINFTINEEPQSSIRMLVTNNAATAMNWVKVRNGVSIETLANEGGTYLGHNKQKLTVPDSYKFVEITQDGEERLDLGTFWEEVEIYKKRRGH